MQVKLTNIELTRALEKVADYHKRTADGIRMYDNDPGLVRIVRERDELAAAYLKYAEALRAGGAVIVDGDEIIVATH